MNRLLLVILLGLSLVGCSKPPYTDLDNVGLQAMIDRGIPVYDIRRPEEWRQTGVIEGSQRLTFVNSKGQLNPEFIPTLNKKIGKDDPVIFICRTGNRSSVLSRQLMEKMGYTKVYNVEDGITDWIRSGGEVVGKGRS